MSALPAAVTPTTPPGLMRIVGFFRRTALEADQELAPGLQVVSAGNAPDGTELVAVYIVAKTRVRVNPCKILFLASNPVPAGRLALDEEARDIESKIRASEHRDCLLLRTRWAVRTDDLIQALNEERPTIVHFSGHGSGPQGIVLHDEGGGSRLVKGEALKRLFTVLKDDIRVVVLSACYTTEQARAIAEVIDCVVGMSDRLDDEAARKFAASFYRALGFGRSLRNAFDQGLLAMALEEADGEKVPKLLVRNGVDPDEVYVMARS